MPIHEFDGDQLLGELGVLVATLHDWGTGVTLAGERLR